MMHVYKPHEHDRVGWSPPQSQEDSDPLPDWWEWAATFFVYITVGTLIVTGTLAAVLG